MKSIDHFRQLHLIKVLFQFISNELNCLTSILFATNSASSSCSLSLNREIFASLRAFSPSSDKSDFRNKGTNTKSIADVKRAAVNIQNKSSPNSATCRPTRSV